MEDPELEALRQKRMAEYQQQQQNHAQPNSLCILHNVLILERSCMAGLAGLTMDIQVPGDDFRM